MSPIKVFKANLCSRIFVSNEFGSDEALLAAIKRASEIPESEWRDRKDAFNEIGNKAPMKDGGYCLKYEDVPKFIEEEVGAFAESMLPSLRAELARQTYFGMHPVLLAAMKEKVCPDWRSDGCSASLSDAENWIASLEPGEVIGLSDNGCVIQWDATEQSYRDTGEALDQFGSDGLSEIERVRVGLSPATQEHRM